MASGGISAQAELSLVLALGPGLEKKGSYTELSGSPLESYTAGCPRQASISSHVGMVYMLHTLHSEKTTNTKPVSSGVTDPTEHLIA